MNIKNIAEQKPRMIYVMDPYCSWCYGGSHNILRLYKEYAQHIDFTVIPAGMLRGDYVMHYTPEMEEKMRHSFDHIEQVTGRAFGRAFLESLKTLNAVWNSDKPCRVIQAVQKLHPEKVFPFVEAYLSAHFDEGLSYDDGTALQEASSVAGLMASQIDMESESDAIRALTEEGYAKVDQYAEVYPTLVLLHNGDKYTLEEGYSSYDEMEQRVLKLLTGKPVAADDEGDAPGHHGCSGGVCSL